MRAGALFSLNRRELKLFLTMLSAWKDMNIHRDQNSYLDVAGQGVLEVSGEQPAAIIYRAGYITSSLNNDDHPPFHWQPGSPTIHIKLPTHLMMSFNDYH